MDNRNKLDFIVLERQGYVILVDNMGAGAHSQATESLWQTTKA